MKCSNCEMQWHSWRYCYNNCGNIKCPFCHKPISEFQIEANKIIKELDDKSDDLLQMREKSKTK